MSARPLSALLAHLDAGGRRGTSAAAPAAGIDPALVEAAAEAARRAGYAEGLAEGEQRLAAERQRAAGELAEKLAAARETWTRDEAASLSVRIDATFAEIESRLVEGVAATLRPLVAAAVADAALAQFVEEVRGLLAASPEGAAITLTAPPDMIARLREALGARAGVDYVESEGVDARASLQRTRIETRLADWAERLAGVV